MTTTKMYYLDENNNIQEAEILDPQKDRRNEYERPKLFFRIEAEREREIALRDKHNAELDSERAARIARQREPEAYTPDPTHPDLPLNQNRVSDFEYHYGEIAFYGGVLLIIVIGLILLYFTNPPM